MSIKFKATHLQSKLSIWASFGHIYIFKEYLYHNHSAHNAQDPMKTNSYVSSGLNRSLCQLWHTFNLDLDRLRLSRFMTSAENVLFNRQICITEYQVLRAHDYCKKQVSWALYVTKVKMYHLPGSGLTMFIPHFHPDTSDEDFPGWDTEAEALHVNSHA